MRSGNRRSCRESNSALMRACVLEALESRQLLSAVDPAFANSGTLITDVSGSGSNDAGYDVAVQSDGKIVTVGGSNGNFAIIRYNADGSLDTSFNSTGIEAVDMGGTDTAHGVAIQSNGKIVVVGESSGDWALLRLNTDGSLDTSFNSTGKRVLNLGSSTDSAWNTVIDPSTQKIYVAGVGNTIDSHNYVTICRFNTDGSLDTGWDGDGKKFTTFSSDNTAYAIQLNGDVVIAGKVSGDFLVARYQTDGAFDTTFSGDGRQNVDFGTSTDGAYGLAIQSDSKILVSGSEGSGTSSIFAVARLTSTGSLDTSFNGTGKLTTSFGTNASAVAYDISQLAGGQIVAAGTANGNFVIARYTASGALDTSFDSDGIDTTDFGSSNDTGRALAITVDGKVVVAGFSGSDFALAQYLAAPPAAPDGLTATPSDSDDGWGVQLTWNDNSDFEDGYFLERSPVSNFSSGVVSFTLDPNSTSYLDESVTANTTYYYRITATSAESGNSSVSGTASATPLPGVPHSPDGFTASVLSSSSVQLSWDDLSSNESGFIVERATDEGFTQNLTTVTTTSSGVTTYQDTGLTSGQTYYYRLTAYNSVGQAARIPTTFVNVDFTAPDAPTDISIDPNDDGSYNLAWTNNATNADAIDVQRSTDPNFAQDVETLTTLQPFEVEYTDTSADSDTTYYYQVVAHNGAGDAASNIVGTSGGDGMLNPLTAQQYSPPIYILPQVGGSGVGYVTQDDMTNMNANMFLSGVPVQVRVAESSLSKLDDPYGTKNRYRWTFTDNTGIRKEFNEQFGFSAAHVFNLPANATQVDVVSVKLEITTPSDTSNPVVYSRTLNLNIYPIVPSSGSAFGDMKIFHVVSTQANPSLPITSYPVDVGVNWLQSHMSTWMSSNTIVEFQANTTFQLPFGINPSNATGLHNFIVESDTPGQKATLQITTSDDHLFSIPDDARNYVINDLVLQPTGANKKAIQSGGTNTGVMHVQFLRYKPTSGQSIPFSAFTNDSHADPKHPLSGILWEENENDRLDVDDRPIKYAFYATGIEGGVFLGNKLDDTQGESVMRFDSNERFLSVYDNTLRYRGSAKSALRLMAGRSLGKRTITGFNGVTYPSGSPQSVRHDKLQETALYYADRNTIIGGENWLGPLGNSEVADTVATGKINGDPVGSRGKVYGETTVGAVVENNVFQNAVLRLQPGLNEAIIRNNVFVGGNSAIYVRQENPSTYPVIPPPDAGNPKGKDIYYAELVKDVSVLQNTRIDGSSPFLFIVSPGGINDTNTRVRNFRLIGNLDSSDKAGSAANAIEIDSVSGSSGAYANEIQSSWIVDSNVWRVDTTNKSYFKVDGNNGSKLLTFGQWNSLISAGGNGHADFNRFVAVKNSNTGDLAFGTYRPYAANHDNVDTGSASVSTMHFGDALDYAWYDFDYGTMNSGTNSDRYGATTVLAGAENDLAS